MNVTLDDVLGPATSDLETMTTKDGTVWVLASSLERVLCGNSPRSMASQRSLKIAAVVGNDGSGELPEFEPVNGKSLNVRWVAHNGDIKAIGVARLNRDGQYKRRLTFYNTNAVLWVILHTNSTYKEKLINLLLK